MENLSADWKIILKTCLKSVRYEDVEWVLLGQVWVNWWVLLNVAIKF